MLSYFINVISLKWGLYLYRELLTRAWTEPHVIVSLFLWQTEKDESFPVYARAKVHGTGSSLILEKSY